MLLGILFPLRNKRTALSCAPFLGHRNGNKASLGLLGWVYFEYDPYYHFGCWRGFADVFGLMAVFVVVGVWPLWRSH